MVCVGGLFLSGLCRCLCLVPRLDFVLRSSFRFLGGDVCCAFALTEGWGEVGFLFSISLGTFSLWVLFY